MQFRSEPFKIYMFSEEKEAIKHDCINASFLSSNWEDNDTISEGQGKRRKKNKAGKKFQRSSDIQGSSSKEGGDRRDKKDTDIQ